jgi:hypothetical protein
LISCFNRRGVRYVVVGMSGINYYATSPAETFATLDYDVLLDPSPQNVEAAIRCVLSLRCPVGTTAGVVTMRDLRRLVREQRTLIATTPEGLMVELLLKVSGYPFSELAKDAATFAVRGVPVRVGRLTKLLTSKKLANRPKDRQFLRRYQSLLKPSA